MNLGSIEDRLAIRELVESFAHEAMRTNPDTWGATWADSEQCSWKLVSFPEPVIGKTAIVEKFAQVMAYVDFLSMISVPADMVIDGDHATGKAYCREWVAARNGAHKHLVGCYHDQYIKQNNVWRFLTRRYEILGQSQPDS
ncbi:nuclear transport factor 2 family protein [Halioxenophilus aromaticivorans]|uniref:SnoaL-like domain-containing protein n=1 Tax=Halioxenophilus aromaticivorans TaxID=1306992 RepID=A0AAV3U9Q3_9ALTE